MRPLRSWASKRGTAQGGNQHFVDPHCRNLLHADDVEGRVGPFKLHARSADVGDVRSGIRMGESMGGARKGGTLVLKQGFGQGILRNFDTQG